MIVGFDASRAFVNKKTGTENYSYQLLKALAKIDRKNKYIVYLRPKSLDSAIAHFNDNFSFKEISWSRLWTQGGLALETFKEKLDVLFVPSHTLPVIRKPGLKTVVTVHDLGSEYLPSLHQVKQRIYLSFMQKHQLKTATKIIAVSKATKLDLVNKIGIEEKKIEVVYEGYDQKLFKPVTNDLLINSLRQYQLEPKKYFLFVGTVQPRKNLERLIKAFARFLEIRGEKWELDTLKSRSLDFKKSKHQYQKYPISHFKNFSLIIAGSKGWLSDEIYELPKKLGIEGRVKFLGYVPDKDLPALYSGAKAFLFPSLFEGFGLPIIEAQACGAPVLTSSISSMSEVAGDTAILVDPYDIDSIRNGIIKIMDQEVAKELTKKGFENIKRFSWEKCAKETLKVFSSL